MGNRTLSLTVARVLEILGLMAACLLGQAVAGFGQTPVGSGHVLRVRTYNAFGGPFKELRETRAQAETILRDAGIQVTWQDCATTRPTPGAPPSDCDRPVGPSDLVLRILRASDPSARGNVALGISVINRATGTGFMSTVYADRVLALTRRAGTDAQMLLGRAIAHEIGHLLLGTDRHSDTGLMRASWSQTDLQRNQRADWQFLNQQANAMQKTVALRFAAGDVQTAN